MVEGLYRLLTMTYGKPRILIEKTLRAILKI